MNLIKWLNSFRRYKIETVDPVSRVAIRIDLDGSVSPHDIRKENRCKKGPFSIYWNSGTGKDKLIGRNLSYAEALRVSEVLKLIQPDCATRPSLITIQNEEQGQCIEIEGRVMRPANFVFVKECQMPGKTTE